MNKIEIKNYIIKRYHTIGADYFKEMCPREELPELYIYDIETIKNSTDISRKTCAYNIHNVRMGQYGDPETLGLQLGEVVFLVFNIIDFMENIGLGFPDIVWRVEIDHTILHELSHAILRSKEKRKKKYYNSTLKDIKNTSQKDYYDEEIIVDTMAYVYMKRLDESKLYLKLAGIYFKMRMINYDIVFIENKFHETLNENDLSTVRCSYWAYVDLLKESVEHLNDPYRLSVLLASSDRFDKRKGDLTRLKGGLYLSKSTNMIVLEPKPY